MGSLLRLAYRSFARCLCIALSFCLWVMDVPVAAAAPATAASESAPKTAARAAILPLAVEGELSDVDRESLTAELVGGLQRGAFAVVTPTEVVESDPGAGSCKDAKCYVAVAKATKSTHVVRATVTIRDRDFDVGVELIDGGSGKSIATSQEGCEICGIVDAGSLMASAAATLRTKLDALAKGPSTVRVTSTPEGAEVTVDGVLVGVTPVSRQVIVGKRLVRVSKEGFIAVEREVTVVEGVAEELAFELEKVPTRLPKRPWGFVSLSFGIASIGVATGFAVLAGRPYKVSGACDGDNMDTDGDCRRLWDTEWIVYGTALAGAALLTLGIAVLLTTSGKRGKRASKRQRKSKSEAKVGVGLGMLMVHGRF
jgi:hypothetical protein